MIDTPDFDPVKLKEEIKSEAIAEAQSALISRLQGTQPEKPPETWSSFKNETVDMAVSKAEQKILSKIDEDRKAEAVRQAELVAQTHTKTQEQQNLDWANQSDQWKDAVKEGIMPAIDPEVSKALTAWQAGGAVPTEEQMKDPGVIAFAEARALHQELVKKGEVNSFYGTMKKYKEQKPAGAYAPVLGNSAATSQNKPYTYQDVHKENLASSKFRF